MECTLQFASYRRPFAVPLRTARGDWFEREGIVVRLEADDGRVGFGEIAPIEGFGSESMAEAEGFLSGLGPRIRRERLAGIPEGLRCCHFALGSAWWMIEEPDVPYVFRNTALLPTGENALEAMAGYLAAGFRTFKMKIGVASARLEIANVQGLLSLMPAEARLRLDANGALDEPAFELWLDALDGHRGIEFLEQPLEAGAEREVRDYATEREVPLALDESLASVQGLQVVLQHLRWFGPLVLKSALLGSPEDLLRVLRNARNPLIFSSVFETGIGLHNGLRLAAAAGARSPVGYGTLAYFADGLNVFPTEPTLASDLISIERLEALWNTICGEFAKA